MICEHEGAEIKGTLNVEKKIIPPQWNLSDGRRICNQVWFCQSKRPSFLAGASWSAELSALLSAGIIMAKVML